jgi:hypothetical protein
LAFRPKSLGGAHRGCRSTPAHHVFEHQAMVADKERDDAGDERDAAYD